MKKAIVGSEEDVGLVELAVCPQLIQNRADTLVDRQERFELAAVAAGQVGDRGFVERGQTLHLLRLVGDVRLVEAGRDRQRGGVEGVSVTGGWLRRV